MGNMFTVNNKNTGVFIVNCGHIFTHFSGIRIAALNKQMLVGVIPTQSSRYFSISPTSTIGRLTKG